MGTQCAGQPPQVASPVVVEVVATSSLLAEVDVVEASGGQTCVRRWLEGCRRLAEPRAGLYKDGTWCDLCKRHLE